jgi:hypothetical protein
MLHSLEPVLWTGGTLGLLLFAVWVAFLGFRNGDYPSDARVSVRRLELPAGAGGIRAEVTIANLNPEDALVGISLERHQTRHLVTGRAGRSTAIRLVATAADDVVGVVASNSTNRFRIWSDRADFADHVLIRVGTPGRLRLHRLPLQ